MKNLILGIIMVLGTVVFGQSNKKVESLYQNYLEIKDALASDNANKASDASAAFLKTLASIDSKTVSAKQSELLKNSATAIQQSKDIKLQRKDFFGLSDNMVELMKNNKIPSSTIFVQYCPMAKGQWLSNKKEIKNPYYGKSMLECGYVTSEVK